MASELRVKQDQVHLGSGRRRGGFCGHAVGAAAGGGDVSDKKEGGLDSAGHAVAAWVSTIFMGRLLDPH